MAFFGAVVSLLGPTRPRRLPAAVLERNISADAAIADLRLDFETDLRDALHTLLDGALPRSKA